MARGRVRNQSRMSTLDSVKRVLRDTLQLGDRAERFDAATPLLGSLPELDSMAVVGVIAALEEAFGLVVEDDEISAEAFETVGSLSAFIERKMAA